MIKKKCIGKKFVQFFFHWNDSARIFIFHLNKAIWCRLCTNLFAPLSPNKSVFQKLLPLYYANSVIYTTFFPTYFCSWKMSKYGKESEVKIFSTRSGLPMWTMQVFRLCLFELTVWLQKFVFNALKCESYRGTAASNETVGVEYGEQSFGHNIFAISLLSGSNNNNNNDGDNKNRHKLHSKISTIEMKLSKTTLSASIKKRMQQKIQSKTKMRRCNLFYTWHESSSRSLVCGVAQ